MRNERGAGRKSIISQEQITEIKKRHANGETIAALAKEYAVSRQALYKRINDEKFRKSVNLLYRRDGEIVTELTLDLYNRELVIKNIADRISLYAFGIMQTPTWDDFGVLVEQEYLRLKGIDDSNYEKVIVCDEKSKNKLVLDTILNEADCRIIYAPVNICEETNIEFEFTKKDIIYSRTDTDGYQLKALSHDRRWFVKSQAIMSGIRMNDWAVEIMASDLCQQLGIRCVEQKKCTFVYGKNHLCAVYSKNFELDGYTFMSFESLINRIGLFTNESYFVKLNAIEKMQWCAEQLSEIGNIDYDKTIKYMLDLAIIDILCGNVDRHTRNFGLFFDVNNGCYEIPLIFDNGMGMFEHDYYKDNYQTFDDAMRNVYVSPYGEDPFEMLMILAEKFDLIKIYPELKDIKYHFETESKYATEYMTKINAMLKEL